MWRHEALVRTNVSEEHIASIIRVERISELRTTLAVTSNWRTLWRTHFDDWSDTFFRKVGSYKNHTVSLPRRRHSSDNSHMICIQSKSDISFHFQRSGITTWQMTSSARWRSRRFKDLRLGQLTRDIAPGLCCPNAEVAPQTPLAYLDVKTSDKST
jgi:hypothetical protein